MTIAQLITELQAIPDQSRLVVMASDSEGNGYSPLRHFWTGAYEAETQSYGQAGLDKLTAADRKAGYSRADVVDGAPCVVLCPTL